MIIALVYLFFTMSLYAMESDSGSLSALQYASLYAITKRQFSSIQADTHVSLLPSSNEFLYCPEDNGNLIAYDTYELQGKSAICTWFTKKENIKCRAGACDQDTLYLAQSYFFNNKKPYIQIIKLIYQGSVQSRGGIKKAHEKNINDLALLSPTNLASISRDKTVKIWDLTTKTSLHTFPLQEEGTRIIAMSPHTWIALEQKNSYLSGENENITLWDNRQTTYARHFRLPYSSYTHTMQKGSDDGAFYIGGQGYLLSYDISNNSSTCSYKEKDSMDIINIKSYQEYCIGLDSCSKIVIWNNSTPTAPIQTIELPRATEKKHYEALALANDGTLFASGNDYITKLGLVSRTEQNV